MILKKPPLWLTIIAIVILFAAVGCDKSETLPSNYTNGIIVGYTKCNFNSDDALIGLFIITEKKDSLLSFNVPLTSIGIDPNSLNYGVCDIDGGSISFDYMLTVQEEIKQNFLCPQNAMLTGFTHGQTEDYKQVIINNITQKTK